MGNDTILVVSRDDFFTAVKDFFGNMHDHMMDFFSVNQKGASGTSDLITFKTCIVGCSRPIGEISNFCSSVDRNLIGSGVSSNIPT